MQKRAKNAIAVTVGLVIAFAVVFSFDYTDSYVSDRFHKAVESGQYVKGEGFSLDAFLQYYDWDTVCVTVPYCEHDFKNRLGLPYEHAAVGDTLWSLVFVKDDYVVAEIPIERRFIEFPLDLEENCFDRWSAIISIDDNAAATNSDLRLTFTDI